MAILKSDRQVLFGNLFKLSYFTMVTTLYTRSEGIEDPKEHYFIKTGKDKATTIDRRTVIHVPKNTKVTLAMVVTDKQ